ncbi:MAG: hypothetical protein HY211_01960 [Candidatus Omnitrophica bacterium]|nr:hypothetical protein [Candidatus Omnitrophota bacterium]
MAGVASVGMGLWFLALLIPARAVVAQMPPTDSDQQKVETSTIPLEQAAQNFTAMQIPDAMKAVGAALNQAAAMNNSPVVYSGPAPALQQRPSLGPGTGMLLDWVGSLIFPNFKEPPSRPPPFRIFPLSDDVLRNWFFIGVKEKPKERPQNRLLDFLEPFLGPLPGRQQAAQPHPLEPGDTLAWRGAGGKEKPVANAVMKPNQEPIAKAAIKPTQLKAGDTINYGVGKPEFEINVNENSIVTITYQNGTKVTLNPSDYPSVKLKGEEEKKLEIWDKEAAKKFGDLQVIHRAGVEFRITFGNDGEVSTIILKYERKFEGKKGDLQVILWANGTVTVIVIVDDKKIRFDYIMPKYSVG